MEDLKTHVVMLASPGMGHLIPILQLAKRLVTFHSVDVSLFVISTTSSAAQSQLLESSLLPNGLRIVELPPVDISAFVTNSTSIESRITIIIRESLPGLQSEIHDMPSTPAALIVDLFGTTAFSIADQLEIPKYVLCTSSAWFLALTMYLPTLDHEVKGEYVDLPEPIQVPGCKPIRVDDLIDPMIARTGDSYEVCLAMALSHRMADGLIVNTWEDLELVSLAGLREDSTLRVIPVGPLVRTDGELNETRTSECYEWLHNQPNESVLYVSFGSGGALSQDQITELAWGLELSQQRFIWVVRPPVQEDATVTFFSAGSHKDDPSDFLPEGFLNRIEGRGMVAPNWAPQVDILKHPSTGGFLSHCGWNSMLESIINGVPMIAWPLYAEQRMNATILAEVLRVAVRSEVLPTKKVVGREEIKRMVRLVMEGKGGDQALRARMKELQTCALKATEEEGSSYKNLCQLVADWRIRPHDNQAI